MKLQIHRCRQSPKSEKALRATQFIVTEQEKHSTDEVAAFLSNFDDDFFEVEDLSHWIPVLERLEELLLELLTKLPSIETLHVPEDYSAAVVYSTCSILKFLCILLRSAKDKRFFLSLQMVHDLIRVIDFEVATVATELYFHICIPASSMSSNMSEDLIDCVEVPEAMAKDAQLIFESLSLSTPEFGILEYLNGHIPSFYSDCLNTASVEGIQCIGVNLPGRDDTDSIPLAVASPGENKSAVAEVSAIKSLKEKFSLSMNECWILLNYRRVLLGFSEDTEYRARIVLFRMHTFFMLVHSKIPATPIEDYFKSGSPFLQDLLELADGNSEAVSSMTIDRPLHLSYTALENILALLENKLRRRANFSNQTSILNCLGLHRTFQAESGVSSGQDDLWTTIVLSSCSIVPILYGNNVPVTAAAAGVDSNIHQGSGNMAVVGNADQQSSMSLAEMNAYGRYIRLGLELYALSITTREPSNVMTDMTLISTIIGLVHSSIPILSTIIHRQNEMGESYEQNAYDTHILLVVAKALYCLELTVERSGYLVAYRESEGPAAISSVLQIFASHHEYDDADKMEAAINTPFNLEACSRSLLESALALQFLSIQKSRQVVIMQGAAGADATMRIAYEPFFSTLCSRVFAGSFYKNETIWSQTVAILKEVIDIDPPFLAHFLQSSVANSLERALKFQADGSFPSVFTHKHGAELETLLIPLMRFAFAICITAEGKAYLTNVDFISFVIEAVVQPSLLVPKSMGILPDRLAKIGKLLVHIMLDYDAVRRSTKNLLRDKIVTFAQKAKYINDVRKVDETPEWDSSRMQVLQQLANVCTIVDTMLNEHRHQYGDAVRDILSESVVESLLEAFPCTLPPVRQLLVQLSLRHHSTFPYYGHVSSAKAISSLLKTATSRTPQNSFIFPLLCRDIDERLGIVQSSKQALRALSIPTQEASQRKMSRNSSIDDLYTINEEDASNFDSTLNSHAIPSGLSSKSRRKSRSSSKGSGQPSNVMVLGVLDAFPHRTIIDPRMKDDFGSSEKDHFHEEAWRYLSSTLMIEWLSIMLSNALRMDQRSPQSRMISSSKDTLRRLYAFHRSSLMEVTRYSAQQWKARPVDDCRFKRSLFDPFMYSDGEFIGHGNDLLNGEGNTPRTPLTYSLRVSSGGGALVREGIEIENSRVVLTAECGSTMVAYERAVNAAGLLRYRTAHGWVSEFRRDQLRSPIVELIDITDLTDEEAIAQMEIDQKDNQDADPGTTSSNSAFAKAAGSIMTLREAACVCMTRSHAALRQVCVYLSRTILSQEAAAQQGLNRSSTSLSPSSSMISVALSKIIKGFFVDSIRCVDESSLPASFITLRNRYLADGSAVSSSSDGGGSSVKSKSTSSRRGKSSGFVADAMDSNDINVDAGASDEDVMKVDAASLCLYYLSMVKTVLVPVLEDKNGNLNIILLRTIANQGVVSSLVDSLVFVILMLKSSIDDMDCKCDESKSVELMDSTGRCALFAIPSMLALFRKLVNRDIFTKSMSLNHSSGANVSYLIDEIGPYQIHELIYTLLSTVCNRIIPLMKDDITVSFPADVQYEWMGFIGEVVQNLVTPLPQPKELPSKYTTHTSSSRVLANQPNLQSHGMAGQDRLSMFSRFSWGLNSPPAPSPAQPIQTPSRTSEVNGVALDNASDGATTAAEATPVATAVDIGNPPQASSSIRSFVPDADVVAALTSMGFSNRNVLAAMHFLQSNNVDQVADVLLSNPTSTFPSPPHDSASSEREAPHTTGNTQPEATSFADSATGQESTEAQASDAIVLDESNDEPAAESVPVDGDEDSELASALALSLQGLRIDQNSAQSEEATPPPVSTSESHPPIVPVQESAVVAGTESNREAEQNEVLSVTRLPAPVRPLPDHAVTPSPSGSSRRAFGGSEVNQSRLSPMTIEDVRRMRNMFVFGSGQREARATPDGQNSSDTGPGKNRPLFSGSKDGKTNTVSSLTNSIHHELQVHALQLTTFSEQICAGIIPAVVQICKVYDKTCRWEKHVNHTLFPFIVELIVKLNAEKNTFDYCLIFDDMVNIFAAVASIQEDCLSGQSVFGFFHFFTIFLRNTVIRKEIVSSESCKRNLRRLADCIIQQFQQLLQLDLAEGDWPIWLAPGMILLHELLGLPNLSSADAGPSKTKIDLKPGSPHRNLRSSMKTYEEKEESCGPLNESKVDFDLSNTKYSSDETKHAAEEASSASRFLLNSIFLLTSEHWGSIFDVVVNLIEKCNSTRTPMSLHSHQGLLILLYMMIGRPRYAFSFIERDGLTKLLRINMTVAEISSSTDTNETSETTLSRNNAFNAITLIVRKCLETGPALQQSITQAIRDLFKDLPTDEKSLPYDKFVQAFSEYLMRSPEDFWEACKKCVRFVKPTKPNNDTDAAKELSLQVMPLPISHATGDLINDEAHADETALKTLGAVIKHILHTVRNSNDSVGNLSNGRLASVSMVLNALSDAILSVRRAPLLLAGLIKSEVGVDGSMKHTDKENFVDFLLSEFIANGGRIKSSLTSEPGNTNLSRCVWATSRFLIAFCAFRGQSRTMTLQALLKLLKHNSTSIPFQRTGMNLKEWREQEMSRIALLSRLTGLLSMMIRASKTPHRENANEQGVSIDTIRYLIENGHILKLLTHSLMSIPPSYEDGETAIAGLLELMELLTRPKLQSHLEKLHKAETSSAHTINESGDLMDNDNSNQATSSSTENKECESNSDVDTPVDQQHRGEMMLDMRHEDLLSASAVMEVRERHTISRGSDLGRLIEQLDGEEDVELDAEDDEDDEIHEEEDEDSSDDDDNTGEDDEEHDEEIEEVDDDEDDENDEDGDDDDDDDDGIYNIDHVGSMRARALLREIREEEDDAYLNVDSIISPGVSEDHRNNYLGHLESMINGVNTTINNLPATAFITPPDAGGNSLPWGALLGGLVQAEAQPTAGTVRDILRVIETGGFGGGNFSALPEQIMLAPPAGTTATSSNQDLLPEGVTAALEVHTPVISHPMINRGQLRPGSDGTRQYGGYLISDHFPPRSGAFGSHSLHQDIAAHMSEFLPPSFQQNRTVMHFTHNSNQMQGFPRIRHAATHGDRGLALFGDAMGMEDNDPFPAPAVWPTARGIAVGSNPTSRGLGAGVGSPDTGVVSNPVLPSNNVAMITQRLLENNEISGLQVHNEVTSDVSVEAADDSIVASGNSPGGRSGTINSQLRATASTAGDERSQSSYTFTTRGEGEEGGRTTEGGFSYTQDTNQAQPRPHRRRLQEDDSRAGDSIPPLIEIDNPDTEGNEDMSVITLPQEDPNQPDSRYDHDDNISVMTHNSLAPHDLLRGVLGATSSDQLDLSGNISQFSMSPIHAIGLNRAGARSASSAASRSNISLNSDAENSAGAQDPSNISGIAISSADSYIQVRSTTLENEHASGVSPATIDSSVDHATLDNVAATTSGGDGMIGSTLSPQSEPFTTLSPVDELLAADCGEASRNGIDGVVDEGHLPEESANSATETDVTTLSHDATTAVNATEATSSQNDDVIREDASSSNSANPSTNENTVEDPNRPRCPAGYDSEVFYSLPLDMQLEIVQQHGETSDQMRELVEAAGLDYETIASLPENIRQEVLEQARRDQQQANAAAGSGQSSNGNEASADSSAQDMDNATFLASLAPDLRAEVLLTADGEFLSTLPPELVAEAQMVRERAASNWQRRELIGGARVMTNAAAGSGTSAGRTFHDSQMLHGGSGDGGGDDDDDDDDDEDDDFIDGGLMGLGIRGNDIRRGGRNSNGGDRNVKPDKPKDGLIKVPIAQKWNTKIPTNFIISIAKLLLYSRKSYQQSSKMDILLHRILLNISNNFRSRDDNLQLLIGLLSNNGSLLKVAMSRIVGSECHDWSSILKEDSKLSGNTSLKKTLVHISGAVEEEGMKEGVKASASRPKEVIVSNAAKQRVSNILTQLLTGNTAFRFLSLLPRTKNFILFEENLDELLIYDVKRKQNEKEVSLKPSSVEGNDDADLKSDASGTEANVKVGIDDVKADSVSILNKQRIQSMIGTGMMNKEWNSLLEIIMSICTNADVTNSASMLQSFSSLLDIITSPLDSLPTDRALDAASKSEVWKGVSEEIQLRDEKNGVISLPLPPVVLSKENLGFLCDVLLSDQCTKQIFSNITRTISRLSKVETNNSYFLELLSDVIADLALQSQGRLKQLTDNLDAVKTKYLEMVQEKIKSTAETTSKVSNQSVELPTSILPMSDAGGRQHDRLLRVVQTLQSMADKTGRALQDVSPTEDLLSLWSTLEAVLAELRAYLAGQGDEHSSNGADSLAETVRPQTSLTAVLSRLLPVIEAFFLLHTCDILSERNVMRIVRFYDQRKAANEAKKTNEGAGAEQNDEKAGNGSEAAANSQEGNTRSAGPDAVSTELSGELIAPESMPGHNYRTTPAYIRNNLSLHNEGMMLESTSADSCDTSVSRTLSKVQSLRKQSSFTSAGRNYSIGSSSMMGMSSNRNQRLLMFVQNQKGLLNLLVKAKPALLDDSLKSFVRITQLRSFLNFDNKRRYFFTQIKRLNSSSGRRGVHLQIRRNQVFEDTFHQLRVRTAEELHGRLQVNFYGEEGVDAGGLTREWYTILAREIFNPNYALFTTAVDGATFQPNPLSMINTNHLDYFKFVGRVIGKAICDGQLMDAHFTRSFYKHVLGMPVDFADIQATEPDYFKTLKQILENPLEVLMIDLTFSAEIQKFGRTEVVDLIPSGRNIAVTDDNKYDYVRLIAHHRMTSAIRSQIDSFLTGFYDLVPPELVSIFSPTELELLICGLPDVNVEELKQNTDYHQYKSTDEIIDWFWDTLKNFNREERASFLQFVTGTSKVPLGGFANLQGMRGTQRFSIHKAYGDVGLLPSAHTCFNQLDLPAYTTKEELAEKLRMAISEGAEGFGFA